MTDDGQSEVTIKFRVVGLVMSPEFQRCRAYVTRMHKSLPAICSSPDIRPMLDLEWEEYLIKVKRKIGNGLWALTKPVAVYINGKFLGDDTDLTNYINEKFNLTIKLDFHKKGKQHLLEIIRNISEKGRTFVYFTIAVDDKEIGSMLFQLYTDLVPITCSHFKKRVQKKHCGYEGTPVHRIVKPSWIQFGGWDLNHHRQPCENYIVHHDRRGVLSMCHNGKHTDNSTQFHVALEPTAWMDYKYVAFGQLLQGAPILRYLENIPTYYESPLRDVRIVRCDEFTLCPQPDLETLENLKEFLENVSPFTEIPEDIIDPRDVDSFLYRRRFMKGLYCLDTDWFVPYPPVLSSLLAGPPAEEEGVDEPSSDLLDHLALLEMARNAQFDWLSPSFLYGDDEMQTFMPPGAHLFDYDTDAFTSYGDDVTVVDEGDKGGEEVVEEAEAAEAPEAPEETEVAEAAEAAETAETAEAAEATETVEAAEEPQTVEAAEGDEQQ